MMQRQETLFGSCLRFGSQATRAGLVRLGWDQGQQAGKQGVDQEGQGGQGFQGDQAVMVLGAVRGCGRILTGRGEEARAGAGRAALSPPAAQVQGYGEIQEEEEEQQQQQQQVKGGAMVVGRGGGVAGGRGGMAECGHATYGVCKHVACSAQPYCFIPELERINANYLPRERFQKKLRKGCEGVGKGG